MRVAPPLILLTAAALIGAAPPAASVKAQMKTIVEPASTLVFAVGGEADPDNAPPAPVLAEARWLDAAAQSARLKAVADQLLSPTLMRTGETWRRQADIMSKASADAERAARAHDGAGFTKAANALGDTCAGCHDVYIPKPAG